MTLRSGSSLGLETGLALEMVINFGRGMGVNSVQQANVTDAVKRKTHSNLKLSSRTVDTANHFRGRMLDLQTRIEFQEVEFAVRVRVEIFDCTRGDVADQLTQPDSCGLHLVESVLAGNCNRRFLDNLLMSSLD